MPTPGFPLYRKLSDGRRWYRVDAPAELTEVERIGDRFIRHHLVAQQYPERVRIAEIIAQADGRYLPCSESEFLDALDRSPE